MDYRGILRLYENCKYPRYSIFRCPCKINDSFFDCSIEMLDREKLEPGESTEVEISFMRIDLVVPLIEIDERYQVEIRSCGEILITGELWTDRWNRIEQKISVGKEQKAVVKYIDYWTHIFIAFDGIGATLKWQDVGWQKWKEINQGLKEGDIFKVRIDEINRTRDYMNMVKVSFIERI